jgi:hypothetical protein
MRMANGEWRVGGGHSLPFATRHSPLAVASDARDPLAAHTGGGYMQGIGVWLSLVEHLVRDEGVVGSNPITPTIT